jgi:probable HAF family extracellular repeat protein
MSSILSTTLLGAWPGSAKAQSYSAVVLPTLGGDSSEGDRVTNSGWVLGISAVGMNAGSHSTLWAAGQVTDLTALLGEQATVAAVSADGQLVGSQSLLTPRATLWNSSGALDLGTLGGERSAATAINSAGQITGYAQQADLTKHAVLFSQGQVTDLGTLNGLGSYGYAINNVGQVVGQVGDVSSSYAHAALFSQGAVTDLDTIGSRYSTAWGINDAGQIVGMQDGHAALWQNGQFMDLNAAGMAYSTANAINNTGLIVGSASYSDIDEVWRATLWRGNEVIDLSTFLNPALISQGWTLQSANDINDQGWIAATAANSNIAGSQRAVVLIPSPVPEPHDMVLILCGLAAVCRTLKRRAERQLPK